LRNQAWWEATPHVRPLLEMLDEYERFGVILTNKTQARLFTVFWGEIEEQQNAFAAGEVKHIKRPARDQLRSQLDMQRKAEMHAQWHLRNVADLMERLAQTHDFDRLVLAGPVEATSELRRLLSKQLRSRVVGTLALPIQASRQQVLEATLQIEEEVERAAERELVDELVTAAAKHNYARKGLKAILHELKDGRIWQLVYADGFAARGSKCPSCAGLFAEGQKSCTYCGAKLGAVDDLVECLVEHIINDGGKVELVRGAAAQRLHSEGGIGAFLRF
jgi:peptide chain release factor subunit 1